MIKFSSITEFLVKDQGLIHIGSKTFAFRKDSHSNGYIAWNIHDDPGFGGRIMSHKWPTLPKGKIEYFDLDHPPRTIGYIPALD
jgi:hypothetical protein